MPPHYRDRVAVITGASSGIGLVTAKALAEQGWQIIALGRDPARCAAAEAAIRAAAPEARINMIRADLSLMSEAERAAREVAVLTERVDVLVNNAGGTSSAMRITSEGNESTFASNHLGHFLLTDRLLPLLRAAAAAASASGGVRIVNVSSSAHEYTPGIDWDDIQSIRDFQPMRAYMNAKLANVLFTRGLADRLASTGIVAHAMHPGTVDTNFYDYADLATQEFARTNGLISAEEGADTLIWMVTAPEVGAASGLYYHLRQAAPPSAAAQDERAATRLWLESEKLTS